MSWPMSEPVSVKVGVLALLGVLLGSGCSVQMAYNNLDRLARWSVSDYIDMDERQRAYFDASFDSLWYWHRMEELPVYADYLEALAPRLVDGTSDAQMQALVDQVTQWYLTLEARGMPMTTELLASLSDAQVAALPAALEASNEELAEPEAGLSLEAARALWVEEFVDRFSGFSGRLNAVQKDYLARQSRRYQPERELWADYRRRWQSDLLALLAFRQDVDGLDAGFRELTANRDAYHGDAAAVFEANEALLRESSVWLINSLTARQQEQFVTRLTDLAADFRALTEQGPRHAGAAEAPAPCLVRCAAPAGRSEEASDAGR